MDDDLGFNKKNQNIERVSLQNKDDLNKGE